MTDSASSASSCYFETFSSVGENNETTKTANSVQHVSTSVGIIAAPNEDSFVKFEVEDF
jgi:hypothetical protein